MLTRRQFARRAGAAALALIPGRRTLALASQQCEVRIHADVEIGLIRPELHGHFAEHLGSCVYGGLWVGPDSKIPNVQGYRKDAVEYLRALGIPVLRWPGGCFADDYHWRDGVGPPEKRPRTVNLHWGGYTEDNRFGTHEFLGLCRLIGAEPYLAGNVGSGTPQELRDWVEYCNYPSGSSLSDERARNGAVEPFRIRYWGVGNENWGCGGRMTAEEYAAEYRRFATYLRPFGGTQLFLIACGPSGNNPDWTRRFFDAVPPRFQPHGFAMHFYSRGREPATKFTVDALQEQLSSFSRLEQAIRQQRALMDGYDPERRTHLLVDEWGVWDNMVPDQEKRYGRLWQQITMRGAVAAALGLNVFHRQADKLYMCNIAQIVNVLHSLLLAHEDRCLRTPAYYAFDLLKAHRGKIAVRADTGDTSPLALSVSASRQGREVVLTCVNPRHDLSMNVAASLAEVKAASGEARILHHPDFNACNTFENPELIVPRRHPIELRGPDVRIELPPLSVATAVFRLA